MFGFAKKKKNDTNEAVDANEYLESAPEADDQDSLETELSIPNDWNVPNEDRYVYAFHNNESPKLKQNQISIYGMELSKLKNNSFVATGLIRNTVQKSIKFGPTTILLLGPDKEVIAKKEFDLSRLGDIPANGARPWKFTFPTQDIVKDMDTPHEWSLAFELKKKHRLDLEESWEQSIADETKANLEKIVQNAQPLKPGEMNFMGLSAKRQDDGGLAVTILIRNGSDKNVNLEQVPLGFKDASDEEIARGSFKLGNFTIKSNTSKPWTFIFPASMIKQEEIDLSRWKVYPIQ
ncbi:accessory Sec system S-layer assembly protein [Lentibacillus cibarius]|uniref:Accessory Sec system S-layer assembly protein n=1 Tax=Lentibacillus cibarius TaxID=2583219 RepID=A0A549YFH2_9BACI|nr:accessory Sec system S-layer assembly protein [Lentibacillus cibarius]TMN21773.1 accessory Sec system S-layer assembly protein [Lentibacillus cibarius]TRM10634.1 accessory Sec system S-layer assembly protein [Lentibacillus cibarius]